MPEQALPESYPVKIAWGPFTDDTGTRYATNLVVQMMDHEFVLCFYEGRPPMITGTLEEQRAYFETLPNFELPCVARVIVAKGRMRGFVEVLQQVLEQTGLLDEKQEGE